MADFYFSLVEMSPVETLQLLSAFTEDKKGDPAYLADTFLSIAATALGVNVDLHLVDSTSRFGKKEQQRNMNALLDLYAERKGRQAIRVKELPLEYDAFVNALPQLLITSASGDSVSEPEPHIAMYVAEGIDIERVGEIADDLQRYATACHIAATASSYYFFVHGDPRRNSALQAAEAGRFFSDLRRLDTHSVTVQQRSFQLFCPPTLDLGYHAAQAFCTFALTASSLWEQADHTIADGPLVAIERGADGQLRVHYLGRLRWLHDTDLSPETMRVESAEIVSLQNSTKAMRKLRDVIKTVDERIGYRLELRRTRYRDPSETQRQQLELRRIEIDNQLAYIDSLLKKRPRLLRFTQQQLPALADLLRSLDVRLLRDGSLRYGFQASRPRRAEIDAGADFYPEGVHYLLVGPQVSQSQISRLSWWDRDQNQPMSYWLDPFWARYYHRHENDCLIFTPEKTLLYPLMHSWSDTQFDEEIARFARQQTTKMDAYMRELLSDEFTGARGSFSIPAQPIYVFSGETGPDSILSLWVLDEAEFVPLITKLGWLNDNLALLDPEEVADFIGDMADETKQADLKQRLTLRAKSAEKELVTTTRSVGETFNQMLSGLPRTLTETFDNLISEAQNLTADAHALNERLTEMRHLYVAMEKSTTDTEHRIEDTDRRINEQLEQHYRFWTQRVEKSIKRAERTRTSLESQLETAIGAIEQARARMNQRLERLNGRRYQDNYSRNIESHPPPRRRDDEHPSNHAPPNRTSGNTRPTGNNRVGHDALPDGDDTETVKTVATGDQTPHASD